MGRKMRSYLVFTSKGYRLLLFGVLPLCAEGIAFLMRGLLVEVLIILIFSAFCGYEILADRVAFGGILEKSGGLPEYCKTSTRGTQVLLHAMSWNMGRQLVTGVVLLLLLQIIRLLTGAPFFQAQTWIIGIALLLLTYTCLQLGILIGRFFTELYQQMCISIVIEVSFVFAAMLVLQYAAISMIPLFLVAIAVSMGSLWLVKWKGVRSYYDETC